MIILINVINVKISKRVSVDEFANGNYEGWKLGKEGLCFEECET